MPPAPARRTVADRSRSQEGGESAAVAGNNARASRAATRSAGAGGPGKSHAARGSLTRSSVSATRLGASRSHRFQRGALGGRKAEEHGNAVIEVFLVEPPADALLAERKQAVITEESGRRR